MRFDGAFISFISFIVFIWKSIRKAVIFHMDNTISNFNILRNFVISGIHSKAPKILLVVWLALKDGWIKIHIDSDALEALGPVDCGGVFKITCGLVKGCSYSSLGNLTAFEAEI